MRFFLVDRVDELRPGEFVRGVKNVSLSEDFMGDHFPEIPVFPGTLVVEALAQLGGFLLECTLNKADEEVKRAVLVQINTAKFHRPAAPGDQLVLKCSLRSSLEGAAQVEGEALVQDALVCRATLTFVLRAVASEQVHKQRRELYRIWTRGLNLDFPLR